MCDLSILTDDEYRILCKSIPHSMVTNYFQKNPKEFAKFRPGFRPTSIKAKDAQKILVENRDKGFIFSFVNKVTNRWIKEICEVAKSRENEGCSELFAYASTLPETFFSENISAFFKLIDKPLPEDTLLLVDQIVAELKTKNENIESLKGELKEIQSQYRLLETQLKQQKKDAEKIKEKNILISQLSEECKSNSVVINNLLKEKNEVLQRIKEQEELISTLNEYISRLKEKIKTLNAENHSLEENIRKQVEDEQQRRHLSIASTNPIKPKDILEFKDYFGYNLESLNLNTKESSLKGMFSDYIAKVFFQGKPVICNQLYSSTLIKCISNALIGTLDIPTIQYSPEIDLNTIMNLIDKAGRIVVLENFLGNFNESLLISKLKQTKDKIIVLTYLYDGTLKYLSKDLFSYCNFLNLSDFPSLSNGIAPNEDPSTLDEEEYGLENISFENRFSVILKTIMRELDFSQQVINIKSMDVVSEQDLVSILYFDVLPYYRCVYEENPLHHSHTLQKQITKNSCRALFEGWINL